MRGYLSVISGFLLPALQLLIIQRYITTLFGPGNRKPAGIISWFLYYAFLVATGFELLFPPQFLLVGNIFMVFMISTVTRKESLKRRCISTLLICTVWMVVEVIVLLILEAVGMQHLHDASHLSYSGIAYGIFFFLGGCGHTSPACQLRDFYGI